MGDASEAVLRVRLFGGLDIRRGEELLSTPESGRARSMLAFVLVHGPAPQPRERLAFTLWPDSTEGQARTNLRHLLHVLRRASPELASHLEVTPQAVRWRSELPSWVDVAAFDAAVARADADVEGDGGLAALREAIGLYAGDLLAGCYDEWLVEERERRRDRFVSVLQRATSLLAATAEQAEAIRLGRELLRIDPLREDTYRLLMHLYDTGGDRAAAVRVYHECVTTLQRELAVEPSPATKEAYLSLMRPGAGVTPEAPAPTRVGGVAFVGRRRQWERLAQCWREAEGGRAQLALVTGEPGVGKTRLVEELARWCAHRGALVAEARSYPGEGELAYGAVISWLRTADVAAQQRRIPGADRAVLARLLPELSGDGPAADQVDLGASDGAAQRRALFEAVSRLLVAPGRPTLLVADDAQWCDVQSLQLVHYLVRMPSSGPLLVVGTVRREDLDDAHPLGALAAGLQVVDRASEIQLGRLARAETDELARLHSGRVLERPALDALFANTEGNPLFIVEALRAGWDGSGPSSRWLSPKLQAVIGARFRQLSPPSRELLGVAATVGRAFTADVVGTAAGAGDDELVTALDELWRRGIIREQGADAYDFAHGRIRDVAYESLSLAARRRNHQRIADSLIRLRPGHLDTISGEVARHHDHGGRPEEAVRWYRRAAVEAQRLHGNIEAVRLLGRAQELVAELPEGTDRMRRELDVLCALPTPLAVVEGFASGRLGEVQRRVLELSGVVGVEADPSLLRSLVMSYLCRKDFEGARSAATRLRAWAGRADDGLLLVETEYLLGIAAFWDGAFEAARRHFERVVATSDPQHRTEHLVRFGHDAAVVSHSRLANTLWFLGRADEALRTRDQALAMAAEAGQPFSRGVAHVFAAVLAVDSDDPAGYRRYVAALEEDAEHHPPLSAALGSFLGYIDVLDGRAAHGIRRIRAAIDANTDDHAPGQRATHARLLLAAHDAVGDAVGGLAAADLALGLDGSRIWEPEIRRLRARFLAALGRPAAEVAAELDRAADAAHRQRAPGLTRRVEQSRSDLLPRR